VSQCQPEYKLPGLYVIDAIVRESRRQFSPEKDLYAPRFSKNFEATFHNLLTYCPPSDKVCMHCSVFGFPCCYDKEIKSVQFKIYRNLFCFVYMYVCKLYHLALFDAWLL